MLYCRVFYHRAHWKEVCRFVAQHCKRCQCYCLRRTTTVCTLSISKDDQFCVTIKLQMSHFFKRAYSVEGTHYISLNFLFSISMFANRNLLLLDCFQIFAYLFRCNHWIQLQAKSIEYAVSFISSWRHLHIFIHKLTTTYLWGQGFVSDNIYP